LASGSPLHGVQLTLSMTAQAITVNDASNKGYYYSTQGGPAGQSMASLAAPIVLQSVAPATGTLTLSGGWRCP
jgi:hypothetical protein